MSKFPDQEEYLGTWAGTNRLWYPANVPHDSAATAEIRVPANGNCLSVTYTWEFEGKPQEGVLMLGYDEGENSVSAAWMDSWHQANGVLVSKGTVGKDGIVDCSGNFPAPPGPDWGWRTTLHADGSNLKLTMYCISPEGEEDAAVEATYTRV